MAFLQSYIDVAIKLKGSILWYACLFFCLSVKLCKTILKMQKKKKIMALSLNK
jgi:hypothetical protein